jgi:hypothetical protein
MRWNLDTIVSTGCIWKIVAGYAPSQVHANQNRLTGNNHTVTNDVKKRASGLRPCLSLYLVKR